MDQNIGEVLLFLSSTIMDDIEPISEFSCEEVEVISSMEDISNGVLRVLITGKLEGEEVNVKVEL